MSQVTLFISAVTTEFAEDPARAPERVRGAGDYRTYLRDKLTCPDVSVKVQEDFVAGGVLTLDKLVVYIQACDAVIHLVGEMAGAPASQASVEAIFASVPGLAHTLPFLTSAADALALGLSYTQWEAYLAIHFGKRLVVSVADASAPRAAGFATDDAQRQRQQQHLARLTQLKRHPEIRFANREELAIEVLRMLRTVLPASQREALPAPPCRLPYTPLGELFIGRDDFLHELRARAERARQSGAWPRQVVHGLGGMGKTRLAVEYAWRYRDRYAAALLVNGESDEALDRDLAALTGVFHIEVDPSTSEPERTRLAIEWLQQHPGWLLVVDNVDTEQARTAVLKRLPEWVNGHVLITARMAEWPRELEVMGLHVLAPQDATDFLLRATAERRAPRDDDGEQAHALANDELGALCLALEQAAAYIDKLGISFAEYRQRWATNAKDVRRRADKARMRYHEEREVSLSVATTWQTTVDELSKPARALLEMLAWMAPDPLPLEPFDHADMSAQLAALADDPDADPELALAELRGYSLLSRRQSKPFESVGQTHRLVQLITRDSMSAERKRSTLTAALRALAHLGGVDEDEEGTTAVDPLGPHLSALIAHADAAGVTDDLAPVLRAYAHYLSTNMRLDEAIAVYQRALALDENTLGGTHPRVAADLYQLGDDLMDADRHREAEPLLRRGLALDETHYGPDHPIIARRLHTLGLLLQSEYRWDEAEPLIQRALAINETHDGPDGLRVAENLQDVARRLWKANRLDEAEGLMRRVIAILEKHHGPDDPRVASAMASLGVVLPESRATEAEELYRRAIAIEELAFGADDPRVAQSVLNLALHLAETGRPEEGERLSARAAEIFEARLGARHRHSIRARNNRALALRVIGRRDEAEAIWRREIAELAQHAGDLSPEDTWCHQNLAMLLAESGQLADAESLLREALAIHERCAGMDTETSVRALTLLATIVHRQERFAESEPLLRSALEQIEHFESEDSRNYAASLRLLAGAVYRNGRAADAEPLLLRALALDEKHQRADAMTAGTLYDLGRLYATLGRAADAEPLLHRAREIAEHVYGPDHSETAMVLTALADVLSALGTIEEAKQAYTRAASIFEQAHGAEHPLVRANLAALHDLRRDEERLGEGEPLVPRAESA